MKILNYFSCLLLVIILISSCQKNTKSKLSGKWKVEEVGIKGLSITYEFKSDTIKIRSIFDKSFIDSVGGDLNATVEERFIQKSDSEGILTIEASDMKTGITGEYKVQINENKMILTDGHGEIFNLKKINN